jgi:hypothetical protein
MTSQVRDTRLDWNGDGIADVVVARPGSDASGLVFVAGASHGAPEATRWTGDSLGGPAIVTPAGDIDGDGLTDALLLQPMADSARGVVQVLYTRRGTVPKAGSPVRGARPGSRLGGGAVALGDIDGDGHGDVAIIALGGEPPRDAMPASVRPSVLATVGIYRGTRSGLVAAPAQTLADPAFRVDHLLDAIDLDGDGARDVLATGCNVAGRCEARHWLRRGSTFADSATTTFQSPTGAHLDGAVVAGDVNGDGIIDIAITAAATLLVFSGDRRVPLTPRFTLRDPSGQSQSWFGLVITAGDFDGDGMGDLAVGARGIDAVFIYRGGALGSETRLAIPAKHDLGAFLAAVDLDADGNEELVVGTTTSALVYRGSRGGLVTSAPAWQYQLP